MPKSNYYSRSKTTSRPSMAARQNSHNRRGAKKQYIDPARFVNHHASALQEVVYQPRHQFSEFGLQAAIVANIASLNYLVPSAIQDQAIPEVMAGNDVVGLANTGTGKTAAFLLPIIDRLYRDRQTESVLIMAPTRELAQQIDTEFRRFARGLKIYSALLVGGANIQRQIRELTRRPHVIIGTPGRMKDLLNRKQLHLDRANVLVLDEADRMLDMGFVNDIKLIASELPRQRQTLCFSATITPAVRNIINDFMNQPEVISVKHGETSDHVLQDVVRYTTADQKKELLITMLNEDDFERVIVFGETKYGVQRLADMLTKQGIPAAAIHGNKSQSQRERALRDFKDRKVDVLVATDVAARGLDIKGVSHVINFDVPQKYEDYVHRIGRTGRAGKVGKALTFVPGN